MNSTLSSVYRMDRSSKKGFTLVELVVVIAILSILAVVAIPLVYNILSASSETADETEAATLNEACREYHAEVMAGTINSAEKKGSTQTGLPGPRGSLSLRQKAASNAKVINACEYAGLTKTKRRIEDGLNMFGYTSDGVVKISDATTTPITSTTTLGDIYD